MKLFKFIKTFSIQCAIGLSVCGLCATSFSEDAPADANFETAFQTGVKNYQEKKFDEARLSFNAALKKNPESVQALTNLALVQFNLGKKGDAVALLRKAQNLDPDFSTPRAALSFILPQLDVKEIPHEIRYWETIRANVVVPFSMNGFLFMTALCVFSTGWLFLAYVGKRRVAIEEEKPLPHFPLIPVIILLISTVVVSMTIMKSLDQKIPRGTIISDKVSVLSAPAAGSAALFDIYPGLEVILNSVDKDWVQITYPGAMTGWIPKTNVMQTSGSDLW